MQSDDATEPYLSSGVQENFTSHTPLNVQGGMWSPYGGHRMHRMASEHHMVATSWHMGIRAAGMRARVITCSSRLVSVSPIIQSGDSIWFCFATTARAGNRRFSPLSALRAHTKAPYKTYLHSKTLMKAEAT